MPDPTSPASPSTARVIGAVVALFAGFGCLLAACGVAVVHGFEAQAPGSDPIDTSDVARLGTAGAALVALGAVVLLALTAKSWWWHHHRSP